MSLTCTRLWFLGRYNVHIVQLWHMVFFAKLVGVFIDIDRLKGKLMQNLINILVHYVVQEI